ncbi:hypothetical protein AVEN_237418-1 [Araneus ventricosus]|uniref:Uncharacterized protein n=1 Tax=Araneus ventricosus TaxID=182803 RepID=A0A4Y2KJY1_ARAVE|nr:hypothetical protein AVEN_237418-1 [Araneus ventricosus]
MPPRQEARPAVRRDECNEMALKFSPDYYLSTTVEYPVLKFSPDGGDTASPTGGPWPPGPPSGATPPATNSLNSPVPVNDVQKYVKSILHSKWQAQWDNKNTNNLQSIKRLIDCWPSLPIRKLDTVLTRKNRTPDLLA